MKKALSFISALALITCAFVSCGDTEDEGSSKKKEKKADKGIVGTWVPSGDTLEEMAEDLGGGLKIDKSELVITDNDITMNASINASELFCVTDDGFLVSGEAFEKEYDGEVLKVIKDGQTALEFDRIDSPDKDNVYGKYKNDEISGAMFGDGMSFDFAESGVSYMVITLKEEYTSYDAETGKLIAKTDDGEDDEANYKVDGDTLTITDEDGTVETFTRAD